MHYKENQMQARVEMEDIDKMAQVMVKKVCRDEGAARLYGGEGELGLWLMVWRWHVYSGDGCTSATEGCIFFRDHCGD